MSILMIKQEYIKALSSILDEELEYPENEEEEKLHGNEQVEEEENEIGNEPDINSEPDQILRKWKYLANQKAKMRIKAN